MKVLTVDDSRAVRMIVKKYLKPLGFEILEAENGQQGIEVSQRDKPDLILLDINMPVMEGPEALEGLRADQSTKDIPVIMLTAEGNKELVVSLIQKGISDYIKKPFSEELLVKKACKVLGLDPAELSETESATDSGEDASSQHSDVLFIDDNKEVLACAKDSLRQLGFVLTADNAARGLELAERHLPKVVFVDLLVPGADMFDVVGRLQRDERFGKTRFIALVTKAMSEQIARARKSGFHDLLMKPFDAQTISQVLNRQGIALG